MENGLYSVTELNLAIKRLLEGEPSLSRVQVRGEISNYKVYPSGHAYFSLKDGESVISAIMWNSYRQNLSFEPKNGDEVIAFGRITAYPSRGSYQLSCLSLSPYGLGAELLKLKQLQEKLKKEGLFDESRKRPLPSFPKRVGVIAGANSAGMRDVVHNIEIRFPLLTLCLFPSLVQGKAAPDSICASLSKAKLAHLDVLIVARGGGASEDLSAFNDESVVRAVASFPCPVVSAVGHEVDVTLTDFAADMRVSTPTAAAIAVTPEKEEIMAYIDDRSSRMDEAVYSRIERLGERLSSLSNRPIFASPEAIYENKLTLIANMAKRMDQSVAIKQGDARRRYESLLSGLEALDPYSVLRRGYSLVEDEQGNVLSSAKQAKAGQRVSIGLSDGIIEAEVKKIKEKQSQGQ